MLSSQRHQGHDRSGTKLSLLPIAARETTPLGNHGHLNRNVRMTVLKDLGLCLVTLGSETRLFGFDLLLSGRVENSIIGFLNKSLEKKGRAEPG